MARSMRPVLYVTDDKGREMLITSLLSLRDVAPNCEVYIYLVGNRFPLPTGLRYTYIELPRDIQSVVDTFPGMARTDFRRAPKATFMKVPALYSLPHYVRDILYVDIDTVFVSSPFDIFDYAKTGITGTRNLSLNNYKEPVNAGILAFRRDLLPDTFFEDYVAQVLASEGRYGDQKALSLLDFDFSICPTSYNSRRLDKGTKIVHMYGTKPFEIYGQVLTLHGEQRDVYWKMAEKSIRPVRDVERHEILDRPGFAAERFYMEYFERALNWCKSHIRDYEYVLNYAGDEVRRRSFVIRF